MTALKLLTILITFNMIVAYRYPNPLRTTSITSKNYGIKFDKGINIKLNHY